MDKDEPGLVGVVLAVPDEGGVGAGLEDDLAGCECGQECGRVCGVLHGVEAVGEVVVADVEASRRVRVDVVVDDLVDLVAVRLLSFWRPVSDPLQASSPFWVRNTCAVP